MLLVMALLITVIGGAVWLFRSPRNETVLPPVAVVLPSEDKAETQLVPELLSESAALESVRQALAVRDPAAVAGLMHLASASAEQVVDFMKSLPEVDGTLEKMTKMISINDLSLEGVLVDFTKNGQARNRIAFLSRDEDGMWKMDFEAFARWSDPPWKEILGAHTGPATVRVFATPEAYFNGPFGDDSSWRCFGLASPDVEQILFGYCLIGSPQEEAMLRMLADAPGPVRSILKLQRKEGGDSRQFEILDVLSKEWVLKAMPPSER
ncbi:MAG: hypothetical protein H7Y36_10930 [Armatimonadetes bacterium]|nr:hypothetical protein [Akkermansiaceae bacterium]